jgi:hypothetical protein
MMGIKQIGEFIRLGMPPVLLAAGWIAIWLLWPHVSRGNGSTHKREPTGMIVRFVGEHDGEISAGLMPDIFAYSAGFGFRRPGRDAEEGLPAAPDKYVRPPRFVADGEFMDTVDLFGEEPTVDGISGKFHASWPAEQLFLNGEQEQSVVLVEFSGKLKEAGFEMPSISVKEAGGAEQAWRVVVFVETDENGLVKQVFVKTGSGRKEMDSLVCAKVYEGKTKAGGKRSFGRVTVSYSPK